ASQLLALRPELTEQLSAADLRDAFNRSGLFLEASLAAGVAPDPSADLKAALVVFRGVLSNWLGGDSEKRTGTATQTSPPPTPVSVSSAPPDGSQSRLTTVAPVADALITVEPALQSVETAVVTRTLAEGTVSRAIAPET